MRRSVGFLVPSLAGLAVTAWLSGCGGSSGGYGGSPTAPPPPGSKQVTVELLDMSFSPRSVQIEPGDTVVWVLHSNVYNHTVTDTKGAFDSGFAFQSSNATYQRTFGAGDSGKTFDYDCQVHAAMGMKGSVRVGSDAPPADPGY